MASSIMSLCSVEVYVCKGKYLPLHVGNINLDAYCTYLTIYLTRGYTRVVGTYLIFPVPVNFSGEKVAYLPIKCIQSRYKLIPATN